MLLPKYGIWAVMKYYFMTDNHAKICIVAPINRFSSANMIDINTHVVWTLYSWCQEFLGVSYGYFAGIASGPCCIIAESIIYTLPRATSKDRWINSRITQQMGVIKTSRALL